MHGVHSTRYNKKTVLERALLTSVSNTVIMQFKLFSALAKPFFCLIADAARVHTVCCTHVLHTQHAPYTLIFICNLVSAA